MSAAEPWQPVGGHYVPRRQCWLVLFARYDAATGEFEFSKHVIDNDELALMSEARHGEVKGT